MQGTYAFKLMIGYKKYISDLLVKLILHIRHFKLNPGHCNFIINFFSRISKRFRDSCLIDYPLNCIATLPYVDATFMIVAIAVLKLMTMDWT